MARDADGQVTVLNGPGASSVGGSPLRALLAASVLTPEPVLTHGTHLTVSIDAELLTILTVGTTLVSSDGLLGPGGQTHTAQLAGELTLLWLVTTEATESAETSDLVIVMSSGTLLLAVSHLGGAEGLCNSLNISDGWTLGACSLSKVRVVESNGTFRAGLFSFVEICSRRAGHTLVVHIDLSRLAFVGCVEID